MPKIRIFVIKTDHFIRSGFDPPTGSAVSREAIIAFPVIHSLKFSSPRHVHTPVTINHRARVQIAFDMRKIMDQFLSRTPRDGFLLYSRRTMI